MFNIQNLIVHPMKLYQIVMLIKNCQIKYVLKSKSFAYMTYF